MDRQQIIDTLLKIEQQQPVVDWKFKDIQIWPILKRNILYNLIFLEENRGKDRLKKDSKIKIMFRRFILVLSSVLCNIKFIFTSNRKLDTLFFGSIGHRLVHDRKFINRYFYPLPQEKSLYVEYGGVSKTIYPSNYIDFYKFSAIYILKNRFLYKNSVDKQELLDKISVIKNYFSTEYDALNKVIDTFYLNVLSVFSHTQSAEKIMKKTLPSKVLGLCYYNIEMFGVHFAANKLEIPNTDIQHGAQGKLHPMYTFLNFPNNGFNVLPQQFWVWDTPSKKHIEKWLEGHKYHSVIEKGNPWVDYTTAHSTYCPQTSNKIILYTLQQKYLDDYILEAMTKTDHNYEWWIRLHPRMTDALDDIKKQIDHIDVKNFNIEEANKVDLPSLLKNTYIHISKFSGSIIEAEQLGVKTIVLEKVGQDIFEDYIRWGNSIGLENPTANEIVKIIENA